MAIIDVIKFNGIPNKDWLVYKYPKDNFVMGSRLIVGEGQMAVLVKGGQAVDCFEAGTYSLDTKNIPILQSLINIPFGRTPNTVEIYFINKKIKLDLLWGTTDGITLIDPKFNVRMRVRAFGQMGIYIKDYYVFITELIGSMGSYEIVKFESIKKYFRGVLITKLKTLLSDIIINQKISVLDITPKLEEISKLCLEKIIPEFDKFGINIVNFFINSVNFPDDDFDKINKILEERAAFDLIGDTRYNVKRTFDVMEASASNDSSGNFASAGIGIGVGASAGLSIGQTFMSSTEKIISTENKTKKCNKCNSLSSIESKFCENCGQQFLDESTTCYCCNNLVNGESKFCPHCGTPLSKILCTACGTENSAQSKFCNSCGTNLI